MLREGLFNSEREMVVLKPTPPKKTKYHEFQLYEKKFLESSYMKPCPPYTTMLAFKTKKIILFRRGGCW